MDPRPMEKYILNARDASHSSYVGYNIDWHNFDTYLQKFVCHCAEETDKLGWNTFGIQYYGKLAIKKCQNN